MDVMKKVPVREQAPDVRNKNFDEVCLGYNAEEAQEEATRCLNCKNAKCVQGCPVSINIPEFIHNVKEGNFEEAYKVIGKSSALPAVCGRVCPQETQCEGQCIRGIKGEAISIGKLERFVADWARENNVSPEMPTEKKGKKVAVIGSGPSGLTCAGDLAKMGYDVTIFEALHEAGGVLVYGIPEFRLPKKTVVASEIENVKKLGVKIETNVVIGKSMTIDQLINEEGFDAVFIGSGAGLPRFMGIPGENANEVFSANEYLTRSNLMKAFREDYDTPIARFKKVAIVGGGNVAMDAARTALRLGAEVHIVYRRSEEELPARAEEVHHAKEEGIIFDLLTNPTEVLTDDKGNVTGIKCVKMELGEPDASGRRKPVEVPDSEFVMDLDAVIMSLGTSPNPLISSTTKGLEINKRKCIVAEEANGQTSKEGVYAGGEPARLAIGGKIYVAVRCPRLGQHVLCLGYLLFAAIQRKGIYADELAALFGELAVQSLQLVKLGYAGAAGREPEVDDGYGVAGEKLAALYVIAVQILAFKGRKLLYTAILRGACLGTVPRDTRFTVHGLLHDLRIFLLQLRQLVFYLADLFSRGFEQLIFFVRKLIFDILYRVQQKISVVFSIFQHG